MFQVYLIFNGFSIRSLQRLISGTIVRIGDLIDVKVFLILNRLLTRSLHKIL